MALLRIKNAIGVCFITSLNINPQQHTFHAGVPKSGITVYVGYRVTFQLGRMCSISYADLALEVSFHCGIGIDVPIRGM